MLILLVLPFALAIEPPIIVNYTNSTSITLVNCIETNESIIYCQQYDTVTNNLLEYNETSLSFNVFDSLLHFGDRDSLTCEYIPSKNDMACFRGQQTSSENLVYDFDTNSIITNKSFGSDGTTSWVDCAITPTTEEIYCLYSDNVLLNGNIDLYKFNYSSDYSSINMIHITPVQQYEVSFGAECSFRNDNELFCVGGRNESSSPYVTNMGWHYNISSNTSEIFNMANAVTSPECFWHEDIMYCVGGDDYNTPQDDINYYIPSNNSNGIFENMIIHEGVTQTDCIYRGNETICFGGWFGTNWDEFGAIYGFSFEPPCTEYWLVQYSDNTSCLINDTWRALKTYTDLNSCGTFDDLPVDNGTHVYGDCDYCTPDWSCHKCSWHNFCLLLYDSNECFFDTGLESDGYTIDDLNDYDSECGYHPQYNSEDLPPMAFDFLGAYTVMIISFMSLIVLIVIHAYFKKQVR